MRRFVTLSAMNALRTSSSWSEHQLRCVTLCAAWLTGSALADAVTPMPADTTRAEMPHAKGHKSMAWAAPALPAAWLGSDLVRQAWQRPEMTVVRRPSDLLVDDQYLGSSDFDTRNLFRTRKEQKYRDTLRLLLTKRQVRVWLREDLHMQCEVKRDRSLDEGRELGLKLGLYYRFQ
jgi:hypothetical protein